MNRQAYRYESARDDDSPSRSVTRSASAAFAEKSEPIVPRHPLFPSRLQVEEIEIPSSTDLFEIRTGAPSCDDNNNRRWQQQSHQKPHCEKPFASSCPPRRDHAEDERLYSARYGDEDGSVYTCSSNNRGYNRGGDESVQRRHANERHHGYAQSTADLIPSSAIERENFDEYISRGYRASEYDRNDQDDRYYCSSKYPNRQGQQDRKQSSYQHLGHSSAKKPHWNDLAGNVPFSSSSIYSEHQEEQQFQLQREGHQQQQQQLRLIEVSPGLELPLYGAKETQQALVSGHMIYTSCMICQVPLYCTDVARYVLCPSCLVVSPVSLEVSDERNTRGGGEDLFASQQHDGGAVGFGMIEEEFLEYHRKNAQRNSWRTVPR